MITIYTLGDFDIKKQDKSILSNENYSYKLIKLFKFFLTYRNKKLTPQRVIETLWQGEDFIEPEKVLRTQISRLRKGINTKDGKEVFFQILFSCGYYTFNLDYEKAILDVDLFEQAIEKGNKLRDDNPEESIEAYKEVVSIYKGEYLSETDYEDWLIPIRNRYERLYLQSLFKLLELLEKSKRYLEIADICEQAMELIPLNENLNIYFIKDLINLGERKYALSHYEYITTKLYKESKSFPSDEMKRLYKKIKGEGLKNTKIQLYEIDERLKDEEEQEGALLCDTDYFSFLYNLEKRRNTRLKEKKGFIGIVSIISFHNTIIQKELLIKLMEDLKYIIHSLLRNGDVFSIWNENQIVFILFNIEDKNIHLVEERIIKEFDLLKDEPSINLKINIKSILEE